MPITAILGRAQPDSTFTLNVKPPSWSHPADKFWSTYLEDAEKQDTALSESWKGDTDGILIFVSRLQLWHCASCLMHPV